ncbi:MAG: helicase associated domain-containing protein, partial [Chthoniobacteraceae bacterium]
MTPGLQWERRVAELEEFHRLHDHTRVPPTHGGNAGLKQWVTVQRRKARTGKLTEERRRRLDALGLDWNPSLLKPHSDSSRRTAEMRWERRVAELEEYQRVHGHLSIPKQGETSGLSQWV